jgi:hypothetical protein
MAVLSTVGFAPPADFPQDSYEAIHHRLEHFAGSPEDQVWKQFAGAWNAVAYRFQACAEYDKSFRSDFARFGVNAGGLNRYREQRDTYGCIANACSVVEAFYYAAYAIGSLLLSADFAMTSGSAQKEHQSGEYDDPIRAFLRNGSIHGRTTHSGRRSRLGRAQ